MMQPFFFAAVGLAHGHIYAMCRGLSDAGAEIKYVYDADEALVAQFRKSFPQAEAAKSEEQILRDPSVRLVASADIPSRRCALAIRAMEAGKHFFVAKAPVVSFRQLDAVRRAVRRTGKKYFVFYSERLASEAALYAEEAIGRGEIGKVLNVTILAPHKLGGGRPDWFFRRKDTGGILIDIGSHQFEQFLTFTGNRRAKIAASSAGNFAHTQHPGFDDFGEAYLRGENGATGYIRADWFTPEDFPVFGDGRVVITGTGGTIELRKYIDVGGSDLPETVILETKGRTEKFTVKGKVEKPFFRNLLSDCIRGTDTAQPTDRSFYAMHLALTAQKRAKRLTPPRLTHR